MVEGEKSKTEMQVAVDKYLVMYNVEVVRQLEMRVKTQLEEIVIYIPESWKLVAVKAEKVNGENLVEVARIVRKWLDESPETNTADVVRGRTDRDLDILCSSLEMVAARLGAHHGSSPPPLPPRLLVEICLLSAFLSRQNCPPPPNLTLQYPSYLSLLLLQVF